MATNPANLTALATQDERIPGLPVLPPGTDAATLSYPVYNPATDKTHQAMVGGMAAVTNAVIGGPKLVQYRDSRLFGVPVGALTLDRLVPSTIVPGTKATVDNPADMPMSVKLPAKDYVATVVAPTTAGAVLVPRYINAPATDRVPIVWQEIVAPAAPGVTYTGGAGIDITAGVISATLNAYTKPESDARFGRLAFPNTWDDAHTFKRYADFTSSYLPGKSQISAFGISVELGTAGSNMDASGIQFNDTGSGQQKGGRLSVADGVMRLRADVATEVFAEPTTPQGIVNKAFLEKSIAAISGAAPTPVILFLPDGRALLNAEAERLLAAGQLYWLHPDNSGVYRTTIYAKNFGVAPGNSPSANSAGLEAMRTSLLSK